MKTALAESITAWREANHITIVAVGVVATHPATSELAVWRLQQPGGFADLDSVGVEWVGVSVKRPLR